MQPDWNFVLAESEDLTRIGSLKKVARNKNLSVALNRPGNFSYEINMTDDLFSETIEVATCVIAEKNGEAVWSGPVWNIQENWDTEKAEINCVGWFQLLMKRFVLETFQFTNTLDGDIAHQLLEYANEQEINNIDRPTWITPGTQTSESDRNISYDFGQNIGQEIINLTEAEAGFDFDIDPLTREMNIRSWDEYVDRQDVVLGYRWGPKNLATFSRSRDADSMGNQYFVVGQTTVGEANDEDSVDLYNLHQQIINLTEVTETAILGAYANAEIVVNKFPKVIYSFQPKFANPTLPSVFEDYQIGDKIYVNAKAANEQISDQAVRIFSVSINIDEEGNEKISNMQTTYQGQ